MQIRTTLVAAIALLSSIGFGQDRYDQLIDQAQSAIRSGDNATAMKLLRGALSVNDANGDVWISFILAANAAKDFDAVIEGCNKILEVGGRSPKLQSTIYFELACAYSQKGELEKAWNSLNLSMKAGLRNLNKLRSDVRLKPLHTHKGWKELSASDDPGKMSRNQGWAYDIKLLDRELRRIHFAPYLKFTPKQRDEQLKKLLGKVNKSTDAQLTVEMMRYVATYGDGHTRIRVPSSKRPRIQLYWFDEGFFVTAAAPEHKDLFGGEIVAIEGKPISEVVRVVEPLVFRENPQGLKADAPLFMLNPTILNGLGLSKKLDAVTVSVKLTNGQISNYDLPCASDFQPTEKWEMSSKSKDMLTFRNPRSKYWFEYLPEVNAVYFQYREVANDKEPISGFSKRLFQEIDAHPNCKLIIDTRWNGGGNTGLNQPLIQGLGERPRLSMEGSSLYIIAGRDTYSAAQNFVTDIERAFKPIFVGEPTGSSPNFIGESVAFELPYTQMKGSISDLYWQRSWPWDSRIWISPNLHASPSFQKFIAGKDPAMEVIFQHIGAK